MKRRATSTMTGVALAAMVIGGLTVSPSLAAEKDAQMKGDTTQASQSQCLKDLNKVREDLAKDKDFRSAYTAGRFRRGNFTDLVNAAHVFARNGLEERCQDVVAGIKEMAVTSRQAEKPDDKAAAKDGKERADKKMTAAEREKRGMADRKARREAERKEWTQRAQAAKPVNQVEISLESLTGLDVRNAEGKDLGDVGDIIVADGKVQSVIIGSGGFLGIGVNHYKLSADKVRVVIVKERDGGTGDIIVIVQMSEEQLESLPKVTKKDGRWITASADKDDASMDKTMKKNKNMKKDMKDTDAKKAK